MRRVIPHASQPLDHLCYTLQGPHVIWIAAGFRTFEQLAFDVSELVSAQLRQPPGTSCATQAISPRPTPRGTPVGDDLVRDTDLPCNLGRNHTLLEQVSRAHTPLLHRGKVASWPHTSLRRTSRLLLYRNNVHPSVSHLSLLVR
jgi:hypothetical protein